MICINCTQGTPEWHQARLGKITASRLHDILPGKSGYKAARKNYEAELICEILTGVYDDNSYCSQAMDYGSEMESIARSAYEARHGEFIQEVGFVISDDIDFLGASPDGILKNKGIEIKCPKPATHINTIIRYVDDNKYIPPQYYTQMQTGMIVTGFQEWDYISFDNRFPDNLQLYIQTVKRDDKYCEIIIQEVLKFWKELNEKINKLKIYSKENL